jgi:hypothetical protein
MIGSDLFDLAWIFILAEVAVTWFFYLRGCTGTKRTRPVNIRQATGGGLLFRGCSGNILLKLLSRIGGELATVSSCLAKGGMIPG